MIELAKCTVPAATWMFVQMEWMRVEDEYAPKIFLLSACCNYILTAAFKYYVMQVRKTIRYQKSQ